MSKTFVIGDIHGSYSALVQCLERSGFDYESDRLICLGDICDRRSEVRECVEEILKIERRIIILGNHDFWALEWMRSKNAPDIWLMQGGSYTVESYTAGVPESHLELFSGAVYYFIENNILFVHGGINHELPLDQQVVTNFLWDRTLVNAAFESMHLDISLTEFDEVYVGHTPTINLIKRNAGSSINKLSNHQSNLPLKLCNVWLMDTGAGWPGGKLSIMNLDTKEVFQSDALM